MLVTLASLAACLGEPVVEAVACPGATDQKLLTADGATVALHHHPGQGPAVLLVHGIASNHRFWDLDADHSLAVWLAERGFDPWLLDLRGHGNARMGLDQHPQVSGWTVDDYGLFDVPAAVTRVQAITRQRRVAYVGHSMGGMVGAIYAASGGARDLASLVLVASPGAFSGDDDLIRMAKAGFDVGGTALLWFETGVAAEAAAALGPLTPGQLQYRVYNPDNLDDDTEAALLRTVVSPISRDEMQHFSRMMKHGRFESADGERDWLQAFGEVETPTLGIAGGADQIGRPAWVRTLAEATGGPSAFVEVPGYGHVDLGLGEAADEDVFPRILDWLQRWATPG